MDVGRRLAANVKRLRLAKGWSQEELADRAGRHRTFISQIERATKSPTVASVDRIAQALGVTNGELLDGLA
jgi:transcriptional regulator with XRE-family HTH domain